MRGLILIGVLAAASGCGVAVTKTETKEEKGVAGTTVQPEPAPAPEVYDKVAPMPREVKLPAPKPGGEGNDLNK